MYGRGTGYAHYTLDSYYGDSPKKRCEKDQKDGAKCESYLAMYYPVCKTGYHYFGCCICMKDEAKIDDKPSTTAAELPKAAESPKASSEDKCDYNFMTAKGRIGVVGFPKFNPDDELMKENKPDAD
jgi:hypothetical protein